MLSIIFIASIIFIITNIDDLVVLTAFCGHRHYNFREIILGQYLGFVTLLIMSVIGGVGVATVFTTYTRWLGIFPICVGIIWYIRTRQRSNNGAINWKIDMQSNVRMRTGIVAGVGITNGTDNLAIYVPLFAIIELVETVIIVINFLFAAGVWVLLAHWLAKRPIIAEQLNRYGNTIVPFVLIGLGIMVLTEPI